jgi:hypothetical protein
VAHAQDFGNGLHGQPVLVCLADGIVSLLAQGFAGLLQLGFASGVVLGKGRQPGSGFGSLAFRTSDSSIV